MKKAESTRLMILNRAFELIYSKGYQTTSIDEIIAETKVTKGAFYYHFKTKDDMGLAVLNEIVIPNTQQSFLTPLSSSDNPIESIYKMIEDLLLHNPFLKVEHGCPAGNLTQEMTPWNTKFAEVLNTLINEWEIAIKNCIQAGKDNGLLNGDVNPEEATYFIMSSYWGIRNFGKLHNNKKSYTPYLKALKHYLESLK